MHLKVACLAALATITSVFGGSASAEVRTTYPQVRVQLVPTYTPDAAFESMRKQFASAVAKKDVNALVELVAPGFVWTLNNSLADGFDPGRDAQHNFRVVFGFRAAGQDADGNVKNGPFWEVLELFANDDTYYQLGEGGNLVCGPAAATIVDEEVYERARSRVETTYEGAAWYFAVRATPVIKAPDDKGPPIGKLSAEAVPLVQTYPEGGAPPTHYEILMPSGRTGWVPANALRPLQTDRLCFALTAKREWKIAIYDSAE